MAKPIGKKIGRPPKIVLDDIKISLIAELYKRGAIDSEVAGVLGIHRDTLHEYRKKYKALSDTIKSAKEIADDKVEQALYSRAIGCSVPETKAFQHEGCIITEDMVKNFPPDVAACFIWLKNRKPEKWRDKREHSFEKDTTINLNYNVGDDD